jgi:hypothetical protein
MLKVDCACPFTAGEAGLTPQVNWLDDAVHVSATTPSNPFTDANSMTALDELPEATFTCGCPGASVKSAPLCTAFSATAALVDGR